MFIPPKNATATIGFGPVTISVSPKVCVHIVVVVFVITYSCFSWVLHFFKEYISTLLSIYHSSSSSYIIILHYIYIMHIRIQASLIGLVSGKNTGTSLYFNGQNPGFPVKISPRSPRCCSRKCPGRAGCSLASSPSHPRANGRYIMEKTTQRKIKQKGVWVNLSQLASYLLLHPENWKCFLLHSNHTGTISNDSPWMNQGTASAMTPSVSIPVLAMLRVKSLGHGTWIRPGPMGNICICGLFIHIIYHLIICNANSCDNMWYVCAHRESSKHGLSSFSRMWHTLPHMADIEHYRFGFRFGFRFELLI